MFCRKCGKSIPDDSSFCPFCGNKVEANASYTPIKQPQDVVMPAQDEPHQTRRKSLIDILCDIEEFENTKAGAIILVIAALYLFGWIIWTFFEFSPLPMILNRIGFLLCSLGTSYLLAESIVDEKISSIFVYGVGFIFCFSMIFMCQYIM